MMIKDNLKLIHHAANKYLHLGIEYDDLYQLACIGFLKAVDKYDQKKGKLSTIAYVYIRKEIMSYYYNNSSIIRLPQYLQTGHKKDTSKFKSVTSLDSQNEEGLTLLDILEDATASDPSEFELV